MAADHAIRTTGLPALQIWQLILRDPALRCTFHEDNEACIRVLTTGRNPTMRHLGRTHRIDVAWLCDEFAGNNLELEKTPSEEMAADIFTKAFPDSKAAVWEHDLRLIKVVDPATFWTAPPPELTPVPVGNVTGGDTTVKTASSVAACSKPFAASGNTLILSRVSRPFAADDDASTTCSDEYFNALTVA